MKNYLLDEDGDLYIRNGKSFFVEGNSAIRQNMDNNIQTNIGEIFTDSEIGLPMKVLMDKSVSDSIKMSIIKEKILSLEYVDSITSYSYTRNNTKRTLTVTFSVKLNTDSDDVITYTNDLEA